MKTKYISTFLIFILILTGCSEDFLDTKQQGVATVEDYYSTEEEILEGILGCYDWLQNCWINIEYIPLMTYTMMSDEVYCGGSRRGDATRLEEANEYRMGSNSDLPAYLFNQAYRGIYRSNILLENVEDNSAFNKLVRAEAKVLRAFWYFHLVFNWGDVPLVTQTLTPSEYAQPRAPASEVWAQMETDLLEAIPVLPLKSQQSERDKARVSKGAAQSLLGKVYLFQEKFSEAAAEFQKVIDSEEYDLYPDYSRVYRFDTELGIESVLEIMQPISSYARGAEPPRDANGVIGERSRWRPFYGPKGGGWFEGGTLDLKTGFNFALPIYENTYQVFVDAGDSVRRVSNVISESELAAWYGGNIRNPLYADANNPEGTLPWSSDSCLRMKLTKYMDESGPPDVHYNWGTNVRLIRYADVLLMAAEAYNRKPSPDDETALQYVNEVRDRAELLPLSVTGDDLFEAIKTERRLELMFEGHRYHDLIRWGDAADVLKDQGKQIPRGDGTWLEIAGAGFKEKNWLWPIPEQEMDVNPKMTQNPGY
ncbi:MAG: RagB/SusD family nutrient uptake outer membrane protein [Bacteroidales bacterium]|nr:RagB/SusD family nutrient uptake outer membrane protein [Bacteroidales bacterium]